MTYTLEQVKGIGPAAAALLREGGFTTVDDLAGATLMSVAAVKTFGPVRAKQVIDAAKALLAETSTDANLSPKKTKASVKKPKTTKTKEKKTKKAELKKKKPAKKKDDKKKDDKKKKDRQKSKDDKKSKPKKSDAKKGKKSAKKKKK